MAIGRNTLDAIGNTPLVQLNRLPLRGSARVLVKLEYCNPTGSYKDRMARAMIEEAERRRQLRPGYTVIEYTGGSTGTSLAFVCAVKRYRFTAVTSEAFSLEKLRSMAAFGAKLVIIRSKHGRITPDLIPRMITRARQLARRPRTYWTDQLNNPDAVQGYRTIGTELLTQLDGTPDAFVAAVGTGGCAMGVSAVLKERNPATRTILVEPAESPILSQGHAGTHHIEGIGIGFPPPLLRRDLYNEVLPIPEARAKATARRLAKHEGIFAGTSTGANIAAALHVAQRLGPSKTVVTVAVDSGLKYLTTEPYA